KQFAQLAGQIPKFLRRQRAQSFAQLHGSHDLLDRAKQWLLRNGSPISPQPVQSVWGHAAAACPLCDLESPSRSLRKTRQLIIRQSENLAQHADNLITCVWIGHDRE